MIEAIRGLQITAADRPDYDKRLTFVKAGLLQLGAHELAGRELMLETDDMFTMLPTDTFRLGTTTLLGRVTRFGYMYDEGLPIDSLTLDFDDITLFSTDISDKHDPEMVSPIDRTLLPLAVYRVPVLAVRSCIEL